MNNEYKMGVAKLREQVWLTMHEPARFSAWAATSWPINNQVGMELHENVIACIKSHNLVQPSVSVEVAPEQMLTSLEEEKNHPS